MARRLVVPDWARVHASVWFRSSETKNMRSASPRWAIEQIEIRGLPAGVQSMRPTSRASPSIQAPNPGDASRLLSPRASANRSLDG